MGPAERYEITADLYASSESRVYRARRRADGARVVLKALAESHPTPAKLRRFEREYELTRALAGPGIPTALALETDGHSRVMVLLDEGAESLARTPVPLALEAFFPLALGLCAALARAHAARVIHKDITPANVVHNPARGLVQLIDYGIAAELPREVVAAARPEQLEGTLLYISPEQTGRMNRGVDYRTDYYALGATLYYALTGAPPFSGNDPLELVHAHLARVPPLAHTRNPAVPRALSAVIARQLSKTPEERYQSLAGFVHDLKRCEERWARGAGDPDEAPFALGSADVTDRFVLAEKLYGRESATEALLAAFVRAAEGQRELVVLPGAPGVGKTSLVNELQRPIVARRGLFAAGKFDQFNRGIPFAALLQAFRGLLRQLLAEGEDRVALWRRAFDDALGANVALLSEVLPELGMITGPRPAVPALPPAESQNRFLLAFQNLVRTLGTDEHPLVLALDDLQWADLPSLTLLTRLVEPQGEGRLLVVGAYREGDVDSAHPVAIALRELVERGGRVSTLNVTALEEPHVAALLADTLRAPLDEVRDLARVCFERTRGNPFFLTRMLRKLHQDGALAFDAAAGRFRVSREALLAAPVADNVVALLTNAIVRLPAETQRALRLAACVGGQFDLEALAAVSNSGRRATADALWPALSEGLIEPLDGAYRTVAEDDSTLVRYRFAHDRVQQAAYDGIAPEDLAATHHQVGERLLQQLSTTERERRLFEIVAHLNKGASRRGDQRSRDELIDYNLRAARQAMRATAFGPAWDLLRTALSLRGRDPWREDYERTLALATAAAEAAAFAGELPAMEAQLADIEANARSLIDKVRARDARIQAYVVKGLQEEAIVAGLAHLAELGVVFPKNPGDAHVLPAVARVRLALGRRSPEDVAGQRAMTDPHKLAALRALMLISSSIYAHRPRLVPLVALKQAEISLRYGTAPESCYAFVTYGLILCAVLGNISLGVRFGRLGRALVEREGSAHLRARVILMVAWLTDHWERPYREVSEDVRAGWSVGLDSGDLEYAVYMAVARTNFNVFGAAPLGLAVEEGRAYLGFASRAGVFVARSRVSCAVQAMASLASPEGDPAMLTGEFYDGATALAPGSGEDPQSVLVAHLFRAWIRWLEERHDEASAELDAGEGLLGNYVGACVVPVWHARRALLDAASLAGAGPMQRARLEVRLASALRKLRKWARHAPANFAHRVALVEAERAASLGQTGNALEAFDRAIELCRASGLAADEGEACERAARFERNRGRTRAAQGYLRDARRAWSAWGAENCIARVNARLRALGDTEGDGRTRSAGLGSVTARTTSQAISREAVSHAFDIAAVLKAAQAIADETELAPLLSRVMSAALEHAGAQRGALVLERDSHGPRVAATIAAGPPGEAPALALPDALLAASSRDGDPLPAAIARFALRTGEALVLDDALAEGGAFAHDPWVRAARARSVLALPLARQGRALGVLVLDNDLAPGAFTPERLEALRVLAAQAAIAIDNALLQSGLQSALRAQIELTEANERFVPREFLAALGHDSIARVALGDGVQKELSVLFSDMRGFTGHVEGHTPEQNIAFINEYLAAMEPAILSHGGFVDSYIGDAILALFAGAADDALRAAVGMLRNLERFNHGRAQRGARPVRIGVGVNTGVVTLGTIGGPQRIKCGVIGDAVNMGARLESLTRGYGVPLLVSDRTVARLRNPEGFALREVDRVRVVGMQQPVTLYEVFDADDDARRGAKQRAQGAWSAALRLAEARDFAGALRGFDECAGELGDDPVLALRRARCEEYLARPPAAEWDGVEEMTRK